MHKLNIYLFGLCALLTVSAVVGKLEDGDRPEQSINTDTEKEKNHKDTVSKLSQFATDEYAFSINESRVPSVREGEDMLKQMCEKNAGISLDESYNSAHMAVKNVEQCFDDIIKFVELPSKIEAARPHGNLDQVFSGYCKQSGELKGCVQKFLIDIDPCLTEDQKSSKYTIQNITEAILNFACEDEGDYIALFISQKGPQCISSRQPGIEQCIKKGYNDTQTLETSVEELNKTVETNKTNEFTLENVKLFNLSLELTHCRNAYTVRNCILSELKKCNGSTPVNVVESIFNLIQRSTVCSKYSRAEIDPDYSKSASLKSTLSLLIPIGTMLLCKKIWS